MKKGIDHEIFFKNFSFGHGCTVPAGLCDTSKFCYEV